ncbi:MAG: thermonuclease family protein [Syntrophobacteraceae bacterium]|nr:thermonuclease family protein [Syntrophobacteraceae bacterium]
MTQSPLAVGDGSSFTREAGRAPYVLGRFFPPLFILGLAALLQLGFASPASGMPASGVVVKVFDGDTVLLGSGEKIRYLGIDAPEVAHGNTPADCHGQEAKALNERLVLRQRVDLRYDRIQTDSHGRLLAYVHLPDGRCVNSELVLQGCAVVFRSPEGFSRFHELLAHQKAAMRDRRGLWGQCRVKPSDHYLGNRRSYVFHRPDCPFGRQTGSGNRVRFDSRLTAFEAGFSPCRRCRP